MRATQTSTDLLKQRVHNILKVLRLNHVQYLLQLIEEHHLLEAARLRPVLQQSLHDRLGQGRVLLDELHDTVGQLRVECLQRVGLVQGINKLHINIKNINSKY
jgi:hypothetical protein